MYQPFDLHGRTAVITGGNGGIGYGMASALLASGATVAIWGSNPEKTQRAKAQLAQECGDASRVHAFVCDVGDEAQVEAAFAQSFPPWAEWTPVSPTQASPARARYCRT